MRNNPFQKIGGLKPGRSVFNLSYSKLFDCFHGQLIPIMHDEMVPGDTFKISNEIVIRLQPLIAPTLHEINVYTHYFFIPYRILWEGWEQFITGGEDGEDNSQLPVWDPTGRSNDKYSLWDYMGFPIDVDPAGVFPIAFPKWAYNHIYNEYYRDQNLIEEVDQDNDDVLLRSWEKDYFTSSLPWMQRGIPGALPVTILGQSITSAQWPNGGANDYEIGSIYVDRNDFEFNTGDTGGSHFLNTINNNEVVVEGNQFNALTFDVSDMRLSFQIQKWMERNARAGVRYTEFLQSHFGVSPSDSRLQRGEYIGGTKNPIIVSEVLQTEGTKIDEGATPQGTLAGHGITSAKGFVGNYTAQEFGMVLGILSILPRTQYSQGINRQWLRENRFEFYFPEFAHLSEQAVLRGEVYATDEESENRSLFGYVGRHDEMRTKYNIACGDMAMGQALDYWTLAREFETAPGLNQTFIECDGSTESQTRIFAHGNTAPGYIVHIANKITAIRPMPIEGNPGYIDHN